MSEYPEHIDQIDDFYRSQLADHEIEPPEGLWNKISLSALEKQSPELKADSTSSRFTPIQKYLGLLAGTIMLVAGVYYYYGSTEKSILQDDDTIPAIEQPIEQDPNQSPENETTDQKLIPPSHSSKENTNRSTSETTKEDQSTQEEKIVETPANASKVETPEVIIVAPEEQKADSIAEIKTTQKAPKEKVKFKDKYKKDYQDSTRKIFVPGK